MRFALDDVRRIRQHRLPLLGIAGTTMGMLVLSALVPPLEPWLGPPRMGLAIPAAVAWVVSAVAAWTGRKDRAWSNLDEVAWAVTLGVLSVLVGVTRFPVGPALLLYAVATLLLALRHPSDALAAVVCAITALGPLVRRIAGSTPDVLFPLAFAMTVVLVSFLTVNAQTRRLLRALDDRDAVMLKAARLARGTTMTAPNVTTKPERTIALARNANSDQHEEGRAYGDGPEHSWDAVVERVRASIQGIAESAGISVRIQAELSGLAPPSPRIRTQLLRIVQEATTQAVRHAEPRSIVVTLRRAEGGVVFELHDDGEATEATRRRRSLSTLRGRVAALGGTAEIRKSDQGWITRVRLPHELLN